MAPQSGVLAWKVADVVTYFETIELSHKIDIVRDLAMDGRMLVEAIEKNELEEMGFSKFQARKIKIRALVHPPYQ